MEEPTYTPEWEVQIFFFPSDMPDNAQAVNMFYNQTKAADLAQAEVSSGHYRFTKQQPCKVGMVFINMSDQPLALKVIIEPGNPSNQLIALKPKGNQIIVLPLLVNHPNLRVTCHTVLAPAAQNLTVEQIKNILGKRYRELEVSTIAGDIIFEFTLQQI